MIGDLKITQYKKDFMGNEHVSNLGDLNLFTVQEGSMDILVSYQIKKEMSLNIRITSEAIYVNIVNHFPINTNKINQSTYSFKKNNDSNSNLIIGSHIGNNYNLESIKEILYTLKCSSKERYILEIKNSNNTVTMHIKSTGIELIFEKEPKISTENILGIFKEKIYIFDLLKNFQVTNLSNSKSEKVEQKSQEKKEEVYTVNKYKSPSNTMILMFPILLLGFIILLVTNPILGLSFLLILILIKLWSLNKKN